MPFVEMLREYALRRNLVHVSLLHFRGQRGLDHTKYHAIDSELLATASIVLQKEHMSSGAQDEEQQEDGVDWHIWHN